jgi:hypothetical protein
MFWGIGEGGTKRGEWVGEEVWGLLGFVDLVYVWLCICCYSGGCLCQGLQGADVVYSWYSNLVRRWSVYRREGQCGDGLGEHKRENSGL